MRLRRPPRAPESALMLENRLALDDAELDPASPSRRRLGRRRRPGHSPSDDDLVAWLVDIVAEGVGGQNAHDLADWLMAALPRRHWSAAGHLWCSINGRTNTAGVIRVTGPLTDEQARHVLWAVRRRARGAVRDERAAQSALRHREVPVGDFRGGVFA